MNDELERIWKEAVLPKFMVLRHLAGGTEEIHDLLEQETDVPTTSPPRFIRIYTYYAVLLQLQEHYTTSKCPHLRSTPSGHLK